MGGGRATPTIAGDGGGEGANQQGEGRLKGTTIGIMLQTEVAEALQTCFPTWDTYKAILRSYYIWNGHLNVPIDYVVPYSGFELGKFLHHIRYEGLFVGRGRGPRTELQREIRKWLEEKGVVFPKAESTEAAKHFGEREEETIGKIEEAKGVTNEQAGARKKRGVVGGGGGDGVAEARGDASKENAESVSKRRRLLELEVAKATSTFVKEASPAVDDTAEANRLERQREITKLAAKTRNFADFPEHSSAPTATEAEGKGNRLHGVKGGGTTMDEGGQSVPVQNEQVVVGDGKDMGRPLLHSVDSMYHQPTGVQNETIQGGSDTTEKESGDNNRANEIPVHPDEGTVPVDAQESVDVIVLDDAPPPSAIVGNIPSCPLPPVSSLSVVGPPSLSGNPPPPPPPLFPSSSSPPQLQSSTPVPSHLAAFSSFMREEMQNGNMESELAMAAFRFMKEEVKTNLEIDSLIDYMRYGKNSNGSIVEDAAAAAVVKAEKVRPPIPQERGGASCSHVQAYGPSTSSESGRNNSKSEASLEDVLRRQRVMQIALEMAEGLIQKIVPQNRMSSGDSTRFRVAADFAMTIAGETAVLTLDSIMRAKKEGKRIARPLAPRTCPNLRSIEDQILCELVSEAVSKALDVVKHFLKEREEIDSKNLTACWRTAKAAVVNGAAAFLSV